MSSIRSFMLVRSGQFATVSLDFSARRWARSALNRVAVVIQQDVVLKEVEEALKAAGGPSEEKIPHTTLVLFKSDDYRL